MAELRRDPLVQRWVIISDKRGKRPSDFKRTPSSKEEDIKQGPCAFCPGFEEGTGPETFAVREGGEPNASDWRVRVIVNKFPAVSQDFPCGSVVGEGTVFGECRLPAFGSHEVVIETPNHDTPFVDLPVSHICDVLKAYQERMKFFRKDSRFKFCQVFKNRGNRAGASMTHSHSQILALPIITHNSEDELHGAKEYYDTNGERCIFCDIVAHETVSKIRIVDENEQFITLTPYAPRFPYEVWLIPKRHSSNYESVDKDELQSMAAILKLILQKMDVAFSQPPFNYVIQTAPLDPANWDLPYYHWYLRLVPHLVTLGGFELGSGCYINPVGPEKAAEFLRNIKLS
ncbi:hypothetical protein BDL97_07G047900 [Sphagnum fallax]|nr:hypothetical protein BDL97_07G047900 [Sphagnum fallax]